MRILIAHEAVAGGGGVESYLAATIPALQARGHEVAFLHHNPRSEDGPTRLQFNGVPAFGVVDDGLQTVITSLAAWSPDVCLVHNMRHLDVDEALVRRWPLVKMMHGYFGTCISGHKCHSFPAATACSREFGTACLALYLPRHCGQLRPLRMLTDYGWASRQRRLFDRYAGVVVASRHMADEYGRHGVPAARLTTAPLFPTIAPGGSQARIVPSVPSVLFAGRLTELKGAAVLVRAVAHASSKLGRPVHLEVAGDGPEAPRVRQLAGSLNVSAIFGGWLSRTAMLGAIRRSTVVAVPSLWPEPFGLIGLEAASQGVPAVAFDTGGISEWLRDGVNGRLVREQGSAEAFGAALAAVLGDRPSLDALQRGALQVASDLSIERHLAILESCLVGAQCTVAPA
jgi:glycosyltransferase involved in cell wall biosynthesis